MTAHGLSDIDRFMLKVEMLEDGCWKWLGATDREYGVFALGKGKARRAHRWIFEHKHGPAGGIIHHKCERRWCVNPNHAHEVRRNW